MNEQGYNPKQLAFGEDGRQKLLSGIEKMARAVKSTLGSNGNTVLIESPEHTHGMTVTFDGVTVAKSISFIDPIENLAATMMKAAAERTSAEAGDNTTTAIVLAEALTVNGFELITEDLNRVQVLRELNKLTNNIVDNLKERAKKVLPEMLIDVASISAHNDREIGKIIAQVYREVGENGIVTAEKSQSTETYYETTHGMKIDRGYLSHLFINDHKRDEVILENVHILVSDMEISNIMQIEKVLGKVLSENKNLLIIAPCTQALLNTFGLNVMKGKLKMCAIAPPNFGYKQQELMQDIALSVGATYFSEKTGDDLSHITFEDLGIAAKVISSKDKTIIINSTERNNIEDIDERVKQLWEGHKLATKKHDKDFILERIASLTGGVGVIYVGGNTDLEQKELYDRVDDAVCAVRSALEEGILPGAGLALYEIDVKELFNKAISKEQMCAISIMTMALRSPLEQILKNAGLSHETIYNTHQLNYGEGYDVKLGKYGDLIQIGVIDTLKGIRCALQNAVSVATTILSTNAIITMARTYEKQ